MNAKYRIRRCKGNTAAWCLTHLRPDGTEIDSYGGFKTALSIDALLADPRSPSPQPGDKMEFIL